MKQDISVQTLTYAATKAVTPSVRGEKQYYMTLTGDLTITIAKGIQGDIATFFFTCDATQRTVTFGNYFTAAGTFALLASQINVIRFTYTGTTWKEEYRGYGNTAGGGSPATDRIDLFQHVYRVSPDGTSNSGILTDLFDTTNNRGYVRWTSGSATQDLDIYYSFKIPTNFVSFPTNAVSIDVRSNDRAGNTCAISMFIAAGTVDAGISAVTLTPAVNDVWETFTDTPTGAYAIGDVCKFKIRLINDEANNTIDFSRLFITYNTR